MGAGARYRQCPPWGSAEPLDGGGLGADQLPREGAALRCAGIQRACFPASPSGDPASPPEEGEAGASALSSARRCRKAEAVIGTTSLLPSVRFWTSSLPRGHGGQRWVPRCSTCGGEGANETSRPSLRPAFLPRSGVIFKSHCPGLSPAASALSVGQVCE